MGAAKFLVCNCERTMHVDGATIGAALGTAGPLPVASQLCRAELDRFTAAIAEESLVCVGCTQEAPLFAEVAREAGSGTPLTFFNIREAAGWSAAKSGAAAKMAAIAADAALDREPARALSVTSGGQCLVYGRGQAAFDAAVKLSERLSVTLLLTHVDDLVLPMKIGVPIFAGRIKQVTGHFGAFDVVVDDHAPMVVSSRGKIEFAMRRDGARSRCDLLLDLSGGTSLLTAPHRRDGYKRADPARPGEVAMALFELSDLQGSFEKPLYVSLDETLCAHSRNRIVGCTRCLDVCPAGAITPAGHSVAIDPIVCGGCGSCAAVCPSGAPAYAVPTRTDLLRRLDVILATYAEAGGTRPVLLVHNERHGSAVIAAMARFGRGLPANVVPMPVEAVTMLGHAEMASALVFGAERIILLPSPDMPEELSALERESAMLCDMLAAMGHDTSRVEVLLEADPTAVETRLWSLDAVEAAMPGRSFTAQGDKRATARLALTTLNETAPAPQERIALAEGAPYGAVLVNKETCTLCLACVSACPADALLDTADRPALRFVESACLQCGICKKTCPEKAISLAPQIDLTKAALEPRVLNEDDPANCVRCGKIIGAKRSVARIREKLAGRHAMFRDESTARLIEMCDDCRVIAQFEDGKQPLAFGTVRVTRTTEDYLRNPDDFISED